MQKENRGLFFPDTVYRYNKRSDKNQTRQQKNITKMFLLSNTCLTKIVIRICDKSVMSTR